MNSKIKAAAKSLYPGSADPGFDYRRNARDAFLAGAAFALKESGVEELREAVRRLMRHNKIRNITDTEYCYRGRRGSDVQSEELRTMLYAIEAALSKSDLFFNDKNLKDGKENRD